jgi:hypothetical protein
MWCCRLQRTKGDADTGKAIGLLMLAHFLKRHCTQTGLVLASFVLLTTVASAQDVAIALKLRAGDEFRLQVTRVRENPSRPQQNTKSTTMVDVQIVSVSPDGISLEWVPGDSTLESQAAQDPVMLAAAEALEGLRLRITLTADGEFMGLANEREVLPKLQAALDIIMREMMEKVAAEERKKFQAFMGQILSPAVMVGTVTNDAKTYFGLSGVTIGVGETIEAELDQPNPLGGGVLPATFRIKAESATSESAVLITTTTYDKAAFLEIARGLAEKAGKPLPAEELAKLPPMEMGDEGRFVVDRMTGLMREVVVKRRLSAGPLQRFDGWDIRLVQAPKR